MAEETLFKSTEKILSKLGAYAYQQIGLAWGVTKELRQLENTIFIIRNVLFEAQEQHVSNLAAREWLQRLQDIVHDIDDLVDDFATEGLRRQQVDIRRSTRTEELPTSDRLIPNESSFRALISGFKYLRALEFRSLEFELPSSIGDLKHLRYFRAKYLNKATLPKSFGSLLNLQYLDLNYCPNLHEFPKDFGNLMNLRYLRLSRLRKLPDRTIGGLTSLRTLSISNIYNLTSLPEEMRHLSCLRNLYIYRCPTLDSLPFGLRHLTALERLDIQHCNTLGFSDNAFQGLKRLKFLNLSWLPGLVSLPKSLQDAAASLTHIAIWFCGNLSTLSESLANLTLLQSLGIYGCPQLLSLPEGMQRLTALRFLGVELCPYLTKRCRAEKGEDWLKIAHVPQIYINNRWKEVSAQRERDGETMIEKSTMVNFRNFARSLEF
ncbi:hypothetical protein F0562_008081 [Nyssa sinensis]|uniref:Uncharacterized protein n=1 Tax=Nyssa sinensis TaxID=561372 RepID=A0A5J5A6V5_9ASTE|nr:hypothetical protein F0562_008081 [Nyssa sinensis]